MLVGSAFNTECLGRPSYRLTPPVSQSDLDAAASHQRSGPLFVDIKIPVGDVATARHLLQAGFAKVCTQAELHHDLQVVVDEGLSDVTIVDRLSLKPADIEAHAAHFETSRFRQDHRIPEKLANELYRRWIENSLSGRKRVVAIGRNFCTFEDCDGARVIDLLSVLDKRRGHARRLVSKLVSDAKRAGLREVRVVSEVENTASNAVYRQNGFTYALFMTCLHLWSGDGEREGLGPIEGAAV